MKDIIKITVGTVVVSIAFWATLGIVGVAEGSDDDLTRSFKAVVNWVRG